MGIVLPADRLGGALVARLEEEPDVDPNTVPESWRFVILTGITSGSARSLRCDKSFMPTLASRADFAESRNEANTHGLSAFLKADARD